MFSDAYQLAVAFTRPVIVSSKLLDGTVNAGCGAFVVVNDEGWIITVAHILNSQFKAEQDAKDVKLYKERVQLIESDQNLKQKDKIKKINRLKTDKKWITNNSIWLGDGVKLVDAKILPEGDLLVAKLDPFDPKFITKYPIFKNPATLKHGTSLCKLGFPFYDIKSTYDEANDRFTLAPGTLPLPFFPIEGIFTRNIIHGNSKDGKYVLKYLETSTPGLKGQSGGPIFDTKGTIWAIQSRTKHFPLGFSPKITRNGKEIEENQFLNVGWGVHPELIAAFLNDNGIKFSMSDY